MTDAFLITPVILECLRLITRLQFKTLRFGSRLCFLPHVFSATALRWASVSSFTRFLDHTQGRSTVGRTPLGE